MIIVTRLNGETLYINPDMLLFIELTPDTILTLINGQKLIVKEAPDDIIDRIIEYRKRINTCIQVKKLNYEKISD